MFAQPIHRLLEPGQLGLWALGEQARDLDPRLMQPRVAHSPPPRRAGAVQPVHHGRFSGHVSVFRRVDQLARGEHLGQQRGDDLHRLDLFLAVGELGAVLHRQHADDTTGAQDRHTQEGLIDLLAGLGEIPEVGVGLGVGRVDDLALGGDRPDQAFPDAHPRVVHRLA